MMKQGEANHLAFVFLKFRHQLDIDISRRQVIWCAVIAVVDVFHPVVGNDIWDVKQIEDIHTYIHLPDITQRIALAEAAGFADELLAEADVDTTIGRITA